MDGLVFLGVALAVSLVGTLVLWLRSRDRRKFDASIDDFQANMGALAPPDDERDPRRR